ncbi:MAG: hypothetical protein K5761_08290 [Clostridiales bacterium]|nr:hypothetical protein [Clostridiales bacterium]
MSKKVLAVILTVTMSLTLIASVAFSVIAAVSGPRITTIQNLKNGARITWTEEDDAAKYRVYIKNGDKWSKLAETDSCNYLHTGLVSNKVYTYTVRALDKDSNFIKNYDKDGTSNRYFAAPATNSAVNVYGGVKFSWKAVSGAPGYRVYRKTADTDWSVLNPYTTALSFKDTTVKNGTEYSYTVRVISADQTKNLSSYDQKGKGITYRKAPEITSTVNYNKKIKVSYNKVSGASKYRVYLREDGKWNAIANPTTDYAFYTSVKSGTKYTFTVRALDSDGNFLTGYNPAGYTTSFYAPPTVSSVTASDSGYTVNWKAVSDVPMYRVYRKTFGGEWEYIGSSSTTSFNDTKADKSKLTAFTLRCRSTDNQSLSGYIDNNVFYIKGKPADGSYTVDGTKYSFKEGKLCDGYVVINGKTYYYDKNGNVLKNQVVGNKKDGYCYAGKDGVITYKFNGIAKNDKGYWYCKNSKVDLTYRNAVTYDGKDWIVEEGKATEVKTEKQRTYFRAFKEIAKCTNSSMTKQEKLKAAFTYVQGAYTEKNPRVPHYHGNGWVELYANDMFVRRTGNCCSYGAAFAYMAKAIGYKNVYACNSGGHGWAEVEGKVYDPEWGRHKKDKSYFGLDYDTCKNPAYKAAISAGYSWMHVKV